MKTFQVKEQDDTTGEEFQTTYDFDHPEDIFIHVKDANGPGVGSYGWNRFSITNAHITGWIEPGVDTHFGMASYQVSYYGLFEQILEQILVCPEKEGYFMVTGFTGSFHRGDGWTTDDDFDFEYETLREATQEEIAEWS